MDLQEEIGRLVAPLLHRKLFVCVSEPAVPAEQIVPDIPAHLRHLVAMEKSGVLLASGPFIEGGEVGLRAMMIIAPRTPKKPIGSRRTRRCTSSACGASRSRNGT